MLEYRVYDTEEKRWIDNKTYLAPNGELYILNQSVLGWTKLIELSQDRYVYHKAIDLWDKYQNQVFEGDYILARVSEDKEVVGLVVYAHELSAYVILCIDSDEFYTLGSEVCEYIKKIGNVFDGYEEVKQDDKQALSESEV